MKPREVLLGRDGSALAGALWHAAAAGCMAQGAGVIDAAVCTLPVLRHAQRVLDCDAALYVTGDGIAPLNAQGARLTDRAQRAIARLNARQDFPRPALGSLTPVADAACAGAGYVADAARRFSADPRRAAPIALYSPNPMVLDLAGRALHRAGLAFRTAHGEGELIPEGGEIGLMLNDTGEECRFSDSNGPLTDA
jgi:phosphomannomutase